MRAYVSCPLERRYFEFTCSDYPGFCCSPSVRGRASAWTVSTNHIAVSGATIIITLERKTLRTAAAPQGAFSYPDVLDVVCHAAISIFGFRYCEADVRVDGGALLTEITATKVRRR